MKITKSLAKKAKNLLAGKKGMAMSHPLVAFIMGLFGVGVLAVVYVIVIAALGDATTNTTAGTIVNNTLNLFSNFTGQFDTIGSVGGVLILLVLLAAAGIGVYTAYQRIGRR